MTLMRMDSQPNGDGSMHIGKDKPVMENAGGDTGREKEKQDKIERMKWVRQGKYKKKEGKTTKDEGKGVSERTHEGGSSGGAEEEKE